VYKPLFDDFLTGNNTLQVYENSKLVFASDKDRLLPLVEYLDKFAANHQNVVIFDKIMGRAAALLSIKADCREVYSPLGSQLAVEVLEQYGVKYNLSTIVPCIQKPNQEDMCPMEALSIGKEPEEFYHLIKNLLAENRR